MTLKDFSQAGLLGNDGSLGAEVPSGKVIHPGGSIEVMGKNLVWSFDFTKVKELTPNQQMFEDFIQLWDMDDPSILRFARKWGPLRIDRNGSHMIHKRGRFEGKEPLEAWRFFSRRALAVLRIASALRDNAKGNPEDWLFVSSRAATPKTFWGMPNWSLREMDDKPMPLPRIRDQIAGELTHWMDRYGVKLRVVWDSTPQIELTYGGRVLSAVALQLTLTTLKERSLYTCSGCGVPYGRGDRKRPKSGDANFCERCGLNEAMRQAQKRRRERKARALKLSAAGMDPIRIANQVGSRLETINRWLQEEK